MILIENTHVDGFEQAIRGMRNPKNSWDKSDNWIGCEKYGSCIDCQFSELDINCYETPTLMIGNNNLELMKKLAAGGPVHAKYRRMIIVYVDITAPLYWWKEFDTYKVGTVANSCSTMHKIHSRELTLDDFSHEHLYSDELELLKEVINVINGARELYLDGKRKDDWWQMIQLLPSSYNQKRTVMMNYEVLTNIYQWRQGHKLDEWNDFCKWIETLPYWFVIGAKKQL